MLSEYMNKNIFKKKKTPKTKLTGIYIRYIFIS